MNVRPSVLQELSAHGITCGPDDTPESMRARLNDVYLDEVRSLKALQVAGEIPIRDYARHTQALKQRFPLLGLPLALWTE